VKNKKKGLTLVELIIAISIAMLVLSVVYNMLFVGMRSHAHSLKAFTSQAEVRTTIEILNQTIRYSTVGFAVTEKDFKPVVSVDGKVSGLVKPWNYIGLSPDKKQLLHYKYIPIDQNTGDYEIQVLINSLDGITYDLTFSKDFDNTSQKIIRYILNAKGDVNQNIITTELNALNSIQVIDWGDASNPAIALAYRTESTPEIGNRTQAAMALVMDTSGSMRYRVNSHTQNGNDNDNDTSNDSRLAILKRTLIMMIDQMKENGNVYAALVPFSSNANVPHANFGSGALASYSDFSLLVPSPSGVNWATLIQKLKADGGTNTGEGIRRGYYQLLEFNNTLPTSTAIKNYMVILVDGRTTMASANLHRKQVRANSNSNWSNTNEYFHNYVLSDAAIGSSRHTMNNITSVVNVPADSTNIQYTKIADIIGHGSNLDPYGTEYVNLIGDRLVQAKNLPSGTKNLGLVGNVFVVGFSSIPADLESVKDIAQSVGIAVTTQDVTNSYVNNNRVFIARNENDLKEVFKEIGDFVMQDLWQVDGPKLKP
jgi:hypothetical protein